MPERSSYTNGTPCWSDLQTTDLAAAKNFYTSLFGWTYDDQEMPNSGSYSLAMLGKGIVVGLMQQDPGLAAQGIPSTWNTYLAIDDVDAAVARASAAGGKILMGPDDVPGAGRMAFVADPSGAAVGLWQAENHIGATLVNEPGTVIWHELVTDKAEETQAFYRAVVGLTTSSAEMDGNTYTMFMAGDAQVGGTTPPMMEGIPNHWHVYFASDNVADRAKQATELGATLLHGPIDTPIGPMAWIRDPQGAVFTIMAPMPG